MPSLNRALPGWSDVINDVLAARPCELAAVSLAAVYYDTAQSPNIVQIRG